ncbi:MAG: hypothetical protein LBU11_10970 [Zoogloeaceae bacterium]|jgi:hypothetical protein|nr:hypothetical protein [Zoogloeaceae bacterium]
MGVEYRIKFQKQEGFRLSDFLADIENPKDSSGWSAFTTQEIEEGLYFRDNCGSGSAAIAFRKIVDRALLYAQSVRMEES